MINQTKYNKMITETLEKAKKQQQLEYKLREIEFLESLKETIEKLIYTQTDELIKMLREIHLTTIVQAAERRWNEETATKQSPTT